MFVEADMCSREDISALHRRIIAVYGRLDAAVNNAGIMNDMKPFTDLSSDNFERMWQINVLGLFWCMQEQIRLMVPQNSGHIINMSSAAGLHGTPGAATYAATKHAVVGLTRTAAAEYAQAGLYITAIAPGVIKTDILDGMIKTGAMTEESLCEMMPVKKLGDPAEIARAVSFLLNSKFTTGSVLEVDGGHGAT
ncbi:hypothetical protein BFW01_g5859 [Lasiodiplodia theobromae]|nr:hypothetical protein BFW01_g5859 [Lasiodiplodia theobromae]